MDQQAPQEFILEAFADPPSVRDVVKGILHTIFFHRFFPSVAPRSREVLDVTLPYVADAELDTMIERRADELAQQLDAERINNNNNNNNNSNNNNSNSAKKAIGGSRRGGGGGAAGLGIGGVGGGGGDGRGTITVQFFEKKRRKAWYGGRDEEVCWESWTVKVTVAEPRTESGGFLLPSLSHPLLSLSLSPVLSFHPPPISSPPLFPPPPPASTPDDELTRTNTERAKVRAAMAQTLTATVMKLVTCVNSHKDHIPPITTSEANPFPYQIHVSPSGSGGGGAGGGAGDAATPDAAAAQARTGWTTRMGIY
ncbi:hypothetical protein DL762_008431 [Monosporascus cannonballus]|uniref:Autophagy-related protein 101 n=1 Tax=Monosporascus cannonballus TaxID=155416 RepID=A0ABY0GW80_9PEZI|nr:hypothetical protein DL762_008431 [Monosporascus cannonballus]